MGLTHVFGAIRKGLFGKVTAESSTEGSEVEIMWIPWVTAIYERANIEILKHTNLCH